MKARGQTEWEENGWSGSSLKYETAGRNRACCGGAAPSSHDKISDGRQPRSIKGKPLNPLHSDLWLASSPNAASGRTGREIALFEPSCEFYIRLPRHLTDPYPSPASSSFQDLNQPFAIQYGSGSAQGFLGVDRVQFAGFEVNQTFGQ